VDSATAAQHIDPPPGGDNGMTPSADINRASKASKAEMLTVVASGIIETHRATIL